MENHLIVTDDIRAAMSEAGWSTDEELLDLANEANGFDIPMIRVEHRNNSKHVFYLDHGESYDPNIPQEVELGDTFTGTIFGHQKIRAKWSSEKEVPDCSSIEHRPIGSEPLAERCEDCEHFAIGSDCKPKIRLLILANLEGEPKPYVLHLPPTSLRFWNLHVRKLAKSNLPVVACNTVFTIKPIAKNGYKYGVIEISIDGISDRETLVAAKQLRDGFVEFSNRLTKRDFTEAGDASAEPF